MAGDEVRARSGWRDRSRIAGLGLMAAAVVLVPAWWPGLCGQAVQNRPGTETPDGKDDPSVGTYALITTVFEPSAMTHLLNPAPTIDVPGGTERVPGELTGEKPVPAQYAIEKLGNPWYDCVPKEPKLRGCEALDRVNLTIRDPNTIAYHIVSHGAAVQLSVNVEVHDLLPVSHTTESADWHAKEVIFVSVPKATAVFRFSSEVLMGTWNGEPVVFEVGKDLPESAKKALDDLGVKQDLGDRVLYSFRVKETGKK